MAVSQKIALGRIHKHQTVTVLVSETTLTVELGDGDARDSYPSWANFAHLVGINVMQRIRYVRRRGGTAAGNLVAALPESWTPSPEPCSSTKASERLHLRCGPRRSHRPRLTQRVSAEEVPHQGVGVHRVALRAEDAGDG
jgi:hypothetical protein